MDAETVDASLSHEISLTMQEAEDLHELAFYGWTKGTKTTEIIKKAIEEYVVERFEEIKAVKTEYKDFESKAFLEAFLEPVGAVSELPQIVAIPNVVVCLKLALIGVALV